jgi:hypothetical protein
MVSSHKFQQGANLKLHEQVSVFPARTVQYEVNYSSAEAWGLPTSKVAGGISMGFDSQCPKVLRPSCQAI